MDMKHKDGTTIFNDVIDVFSSKGYFKQDLEEGVSSALQDMPAYQSLMDAFYTKIDKQLMIARGFK